jgi:hypothetical protein
MNEVEYRHNTCIIDEEEGALIPKNLFQCLLLLSVVMTCGIALAQEEVIDEYIEPDEGYLDFTVTEEEGGAVLEGLTGLRLWAPPNAVQFKMSVACPSPYDDFYGIYAVFTNGQGEDELWFMVIEGSSGSYDYGRMLDNCQVPIGAATTIDNIDCTHDPYYVYAVFDRLDGEDRINAQWVRSSPYTCNIEGPFDVNDCGGGPPQDPTPFRTSIAYHDGRIAIPMGSGGTSSYCVDLFDADGPLIFHHTPRR